MQSLILAGILTANCVLAATAISTEILLRSDSPNGRAIIPVSPFRAFQSGERFRLRITPPAQGFLYVVLQGSRDEVNLLYPYPEIAFGGNRVSRGKPRTVPERAWLRFDNVPGPEDLYIVWSAEPLDRLEAAARGGSGLMLDDMLDLQHLAGMATRHVPPLVVQRIRLAHVENFGHNTIR